MTPRAILSLRNVRVRFGGLVALDVSALDFPDQSGVSTVIMGPNGAGKTTLLNAVTGYARITDGGEIHLNGDRRTDLGRLSPSAIVRMGVARTFQMPAVFRSLSVRDVARISAAFGRPKFQMSDALREPVSRPAPDPAGGLIPELLERLRLSEFADRRMGELPLAVLRRVELARCLAAQPRTILFDEPSSGADHRERGHLGDFLREGLPAMVSDFHARRIFRHDRLTAVVVTHDMALARSLAPASADGGPLAHVLMEGRLAASGSLKDVLRDPHLQDAYFRG